MVEKAGLHKGILGLPGLAGGGGDGGGDAHTVLIGAGTGVHAVVAPGVVGDIGVLIGGGGQGDLEPGGGIGDEAAGHIFHPGLYLKHFVVVALALVLAACNEIGPLVADILAYVHAGTRQSAGAEEPASVTDKTRRDFFMFDYLTFF